MSKTCAIEAEVKLPIIRPPRPVRLLTRPAGRAGKCGERSIFPNDRTFSNGQFTDVRPRQTFPPLESSPSALSPRTWGELGLIVSQHFSFYRPKFPSGKDLHHKPCKRPSTPFVQGAASYGPLFPVIGLAWCHGGGNVVVGFQ